MKVPAYADTPKRSIFLFAAESGTSVHTPGNIQIITIIVSIVYVACKADATGFTLRAYRNTVLFIASRIADKTHVFIGKTLKYILVIRGICHVHGIIQAHIQLVFFSKHITI